MRLAIVILSLTAVAVTLVQMRRTELAAKCEIQRLELERVSLRRTMWDQQMRLSYVLSPLEVQRRAEEMALDLVSPDPSQKRLASGEVNPRKWER